MKPLSVQLRYRQWLLVVLVVFTIAVWLVGLPSLSALPSNAAYLKRLDSSGIDASAMVYTELPPSMFLDAGDWVIQH
ncbi:MAG: hypothetical protein AAF539_01000 [Planctomycetota bacterium]